MQLEPRPITGFFRCLYVHVSSTWRVNHFNLFWYITEFTNLYNMFNLIKKKFFKFCGYVLIIFNFWTDPLLTPFPQKYATALFSFLYHLASYENGKWFFAFNLWWPDLIDLKGDTQVVCSTCRCGGPGVLWNDGVSPEGH